MGPKTTGVAKSTGVLSALVVLGLEPAARANDVSDELTVGELSSSTYGTNSPYMSDRLGGSVDPSEKLSLSLDATFTRYFKENRVPAENIFQFAVAGDYDVDDHWSFGIDARGSPPSTAVTPTPAGPVRSRTSLLGAGLSVEYDSASEDDSSTPDERRFETIVESSLVLTEYSTTQRSRFAGRSSPSSLTQFRGSAGVTEVFWQTTETGLFATWFGFSTDPTGTGYFGTSVFGREAVSEGLPLEPLRWSVRPSFRQRFGSVHVGAYVQYGRYVDDAGWNITAGVKTQIKVSSAWRIWASANLQRDDESSGGTLLIPWASIGARVVL
jgi:hypothetical protein